MSVITKMLAIVRIFDCSRRKQSSGMGSEWSVPIWDQHSGQLKKPSSKQNMAIIC